MDDDGRGVNHFPDEIDAAVNLSFSFRTPSTSSYLLVGVNERKDRRRHTTNRGNENSLVGSCLLSFFLSFISTKR